MKYRRATQEDVVRIVELLANDKLGQQRERFTESLPEVYYQAFESIDRDPNQKLMVVEERVS